MESRCREMNEFKKVSFVIPCFCSEKTVLNVVEEIEETMAQRKELEYEIILVNDGSPDCVWNVIVERSQKDSHIIGINLAKNFGQHSALMAGYNYCVGDIVVSLDDDGQTPANEVFSLIDELKKGYDVVYASYPENHQTLFRRWGSNFAKKMSDYMFDIKGDERKGSSYFVCKRFIIEEITKYEHSYPYIAGLILRVTRNIGFVPVQHRDRLIGCSGYNLKSLVSLWLNGFTAFSVKPLELGAYMGFGMAFLGFLYAIYTIMRRLFTSTIVEGWSSLIAITLIVGGIVMIMLGLTGEYIGRIYICINNSPQFVVKEICKQHEKKGKN